MRMTPRLGEQRSRVTVKTICPSCGRVIKSETRTLPVDEPHTATKPALFACKQCREQAGGW